MNPADDLTQLRVDLLNDFFFFNRFIFKEKTGRDFMVSQPVGNISHFYEIADALTAVFKGEIKRLIINCPPGWSKTEMCKRFIEWTMAWYGDSKFLYISFAHELASNHTHSIKQTLCMSIYKKLFGLEIPRDSSAKDFFQTNKGGAVAAFGSSGAITGRDAGLPGLDRFSGAIIIDDIHKPNEVHSDTIREKVKSNYFETIETRLRSHTVPIIIIGQRLHQDDLFGHLMSGADGQQWDKVIIKALDGAGNARYPEVMPKEVLLNKKNTQPYVYSSQYQQEPIPSGGALYKEEDFPLFENEPDILGTFITADSAETNKEWNDKTVFSFWGVYRIKFNNVDIPDLFGLHWLDCWELSVEPKDLEDNFLEFWAMAMRHTVKPQLAIIENKSTGVTLISVLKKQQGIKILPIERTVASGSKSQRFIDMQQFIASKQVSLPLYGKHTTMCLKHMTEITANNAHRFDDIADTCYDAVRAGLIDKIIVTRFTNAHNYDNMASQMANTAKNIDYLRKKAFTQGR